MMSSVLTIRLFARGGVASEARSLPLMVLWKWRNTNERRARNYTRPMTRPRELANAWRAAGFSDVVQRVVTRFEGACRGDIPVKGVLEGDKLALRHVAKAGVREDCGLNWELRVAGQKLEGKTKSGDALRLSR
jgi:hypothetical protein